MLSVRQILKIGRLLDQTGEPRPGFLHDETDNLEGQGCALEPGALRTSRVATGVAPLGSTDISVHLKLDYEVDRKTGDVRIVKRS